MRRNFLKSLAAVTASAFCLEPASAKQTGEITKASFGRKICFACNGEIFKIVDKNATKWFKNGELHRVDGPAIERWDGAKEWYSNGLLHRTDGPAIECANGDKYWYLDGKKHRIDGPAVENANGDKYWFRDGKCFAGEVRRVPCEPLEITRNS